MLTFSAKVAGQDIEVSVSGEGFVRISRTVLKLEPSDWEQLKASLGQGWGDIFLRLCLYDETLEGGTMDEEHGPRTINFLRAI